MTHAITIPVAPAIIPIATFVTPQVMATYQTIDDVPYQLQAMETVMVFIDNNGNIFHLNGPLAGREGVFFWENLKGEHHVWFDQVTIEGAYQEGAIITRQNYGPRKISLRVFIGSPGMNNISYRIAEDRWWAGQDEANGGWFGVFTRATGWRWIQVWPAKTVETSQKRDPVAYDNNCAIWDIDWIAPVPYYSKPAVLTQPWIASNSGAPDANGFYHGTIFVPNRADMTSYVRYLVTSAIPGGNAGSCSVQDNNSSHMEPLPTILPSDGDVIVDTDPKHKPLLCQNDPQPDEFFAITSATGLLDFFLQQITTSSHQAMWLRKYMRFNYVIPPYTVVPLHVMHTNPNAQIVAQLPQRYKRSR